VGEFGCGPGVLVDGVLERCGDAVHGTGIWAGNPFPGGEAPFSSDFDPDFPFITDTCPEYHQNAIKMAGVIASRQLTQNRWIHKS